MNTFNAPGLASSDRDARPPWWWHRSSISPLIGALLLSSASLGCGSSDLEVNTQADDTTSVTSPPGADRPGPSTDDPATDDPTTDPPTTMPPIEEEDPMHPQRPAFEPAVAVMPRLTSSQYRNILVDVFGADLPPTPVEADTNPYLFYTIGAATTEISERGVEQYADAALTVAQAVFSEASRRDRLVGCTPTTADDACARGFITTLGRRLWRRPLTEDELSRWLAVSRDTGGESPWRGLETVVAGLLQSPHFVYRIELGEADNAQSGVRQYTAWEMAGRLAFLFWNTGPDEALLDAAARGELLDEVTLFEQANRLSNDPRARRALQDFFAQYLDLGRLAKVERSPERYPGFSPALLAAMETEVRLLVDDIVYRRDGDIRRLF
ncbi:MAG: DUF1592 domain-containing protein, partial [Myxococcota bacterium]